MIQTLIRTRNLFALLTLFGLAQGSGIAADQPAFNSDNLVAEAQKYEHGEGVSRDTGKAAELYCAAARDGVTDGAYKLGWMYANGRGIQRDDGYAVALFQLAASQGHVYAERTLQLMRSDNVRLPSCMTPPPAQQAETENPLPQTWLSEEKRQKIVELAHQLAPQFDVDARLVLAVIAAESAFDVTAKSPKNAQGLMQLIPETAERFQVKKILDPIQNMRGGIAYLRWLLAYFQGDVQLALAGYNAGEKAVDRYKGVPPYSETRQYVERVTKLYGKLTHRYDQTITDPSPLLFARKPKLVQISARSNPASQ